MTKLYQYQKKAVQWMLKRPRSYIAIDMGMGKTAISLTWAKAISHEVKSFLVIAPLRTIHTTWPEEIAKWAPELSYTILHGPNKADNLGKKVDLYLINFETIPWLFDQVKQYFKLTGQVPFRGLILDEGSMVKSSCTKRFSVLKKLMPIFNTYRVFLSGTPAPNSLLDLWSQYFLLDDGERLGKYITHYKQEHFMQVDRKGYVWAIRKGSKKVIYKAIEDITYRLDSDDYLKLPERIDNVIKLQMPPAIQKKYSALEKEFFTQLTSDEHVEAQSTAALSMKLRQFVQGAVYTGIKIKNGLYKDANGNHINYNPYSIIHTIKIQALKALVEESGGQGILCAIQFKFELDLIKKVFPKAPVIAGGVPIAESTRLINLWNKGEIPLLLVHPQSISHGTNLQSGSHLILWFGLTWSSEQYLQLNKRLHRNGQKKAVIVHHLVMKDTIDEKVLGALRGKISGQNAFLNYLRNLYLGET